jgi:large subunit ribosomal protein L17
MLANMAASLILNKRITTTTAKAKALKRYVEPLITKSKNDTTHSRRVVFSYLQDKESSQVLFDEVAEKVADRPGGYTRIIKLGNRLGDNADMCMIELVDYNEIYQTGETKKKRTRRSRRGGSGGGKKSTEANQQETSGQAAEQEAKEDDKPQQAQAEAASLEKEPTEEQTSGDESSENTDEGKDKEEK